MKTTLACLGLAALALAPLDDGPSGAAGETGVQLDRIVFEAVVPESTPADAGLWVSGSLPELGSWNGRGIEMSLGADGIWRAEVALPRGSRADFKITRGSWETVEKSPEGYEIANHSHEVLGPDTVRVVVGSWRDQTEERPPATRSGDIRIHEDVTSRFLDRFRDVWVYLPSGYGDQAGRRYPVLYMHDGQNIFDRFTSFLGIEWGVDETAEALIRSGEVEPLIIVGVENTDQRVAEYTPVPDPDRGGGRGDDYGRFLAEELKPFIDQTYRTQPEREGTGIAGSSLGGLISMHLLVTRAETFGRAGVVSPSVWWAGQAILRTVEEHPKPEGRLWVDMGTREGDTDAKCAMHLEGARALRDVLVAKGWDLGSDFRYVEDEGAVHNEGAWAKRFPDMLRFLYPGGR